MKFQQRKYTNTRRLNVPTTRWRDQARVRGSYILGRESRERTLTQPCKDKKLRSYSPRYLYPKHVIMSSPSRGLPSSYLPLLYVTANSVFSRRCLSFPSLSPSPSLSSSLFPSATLSIRFARSAVSRVFSLPSRCLSWSSHSLFLSSESKTTVYERDISRDTFYGFVNTPASGRFFWCSSLSSSPTYLPPSCPEVPRPVRQIRRKRTRESHFTTYPNSQTCPLPSTY